MTWSTFRSTCGKSLSRWRSSTRRRRPTRGLSLPELFLGDAVRVGQVLNNLTGNAVKFTEKGSVRIHCGMEASREEGQQPLVRISVSDTGVGIAREKLDMLFRPFTQADASITRRFGGTGLGLAISDKIVRMMGGEFTVSSRPGGGTDFEFTLLLQTAGAELAGYAEADSSEELSTLHLEGKRILVAEDNEINQVLMEELLAATGAKVTLAENGQVAVDAARSQPFDLVLMDMQMPVMDGIQASREIREFAGPDVLPIVAVTANAMKEDKELGVAAGLNDYITKPIEPRQLILALKRWLR